MKVLKVILITLFSVVILIVAIFFSIGYFKPIPSGISIDSTPKSIVYINGKQVGSTPYKETIEEESLKIKLVPEGLSIDPYEVSVKLNEGVETVVKHFFANSVEESQGFVLSFDKDESKSTSMVVNTDPANAQVFVDGVVKGFTPYKMTTITPAKHKIAVKLANYTDLEIPINLSEGYKLNIFAKLGKAPPPTPSPSPTPTIRTYIEILDTPTGFLRVRTAPGSGGEEIAEVKPKSKYLFLEEDAGTGWYKIQYSEPKAGLPDGIQGWVSNQYSKKVEE